MTRWWLQVFTAVAIVTSPAFAQETPPSDSSTPPIDVTQPDGAIPPVDNTVQPTDNGAPPPDTSGQPNNPVPQPLDTPVAAGQSAASCSAAQEQAVTNTVRGRPPRPTPKPGPSQTVVPVFCKPFSGEYFTATFFDHEFPIGLSDDDGNLLTWWGLRVWPNNDDGHTGYDWGMAEGTPLLAVAPGTVVFAGATAPSACLLLGGRETTGLRVVIEHQVNTPTEALRVRSQYDHLSRVDVQVSQEVIPGDQIGLSGITGCSTGYHVHFQTDLFAKGRFIPVDPYGWEGPTADPWAQDPRGTQSFWLWQDGQAPVLVWDRELAPNCPTSAPCSVPSNAPVVITYVRWLAMHDDQNPNNEFVELTLDSRFVPSGTYDLSRSTLRNNQGDTFTFPDGFRIQQGVPVRVYVGPGQNSSTELYWGRNSSVFNPMGDCVRFQRPGTVGSGYRVAGPGGSCQ